MNRYNMLQAIYMSFYSRNLYRDVAANWGAKTFLYLLLLLFLSWVLFSYEIQHALNLAYQQNSDKIFEQIPVITITNGKISTPENRPYVIVDPNSQEKIAIIDTSGTYKTIQEAQAPFLITETQFISQPKAGETKINEIPANFSFVADPQVIKGYVSKYLGYVWIVFLFLFTIGSYIYRILQALLYAIIGKIGSALFGFHLNYDTILPIAMVAITPVIVLSTILDFFNVIFPYQGLLYFFLAMFYLFYGMIANKAKPS